MGGSDVETGEGDASPTVDDQRLEEARARSLEETEADFSTRSKQKGLLARCMKWMTHEDRLRISAKIFLFLQLVLLAGFMLLASGFMIPSNNVIQAICVVDLGLTMNSLLGIHMYTKYGTMSLVDLQTYITSKQEFESFHRSYTCIKWHAVMVIRPLLTALFQTILMVVGLLLTLNFYNVRPVAWKEAGNGSTTASLRGNVLIVDGCRDKRALNYEPRAVVHMPTRCDFDRCYEDVYAVANEMPLAAVAAVGTISVVYVLCVLQAYILSQTHLHYYEGLYKQRCSQKLVIKSIWRKTVSWCQAGLCIALIIGKLSLPRHWYFEFDISVLVLGYECGRHLPRVGYMVDDDSECGGARDLFHTTRRMKWHRDSFYHYYFFTVGQTMLAVSGIYRIVPHGATLSGLYKVAPCGGVMSDDMRKYGSEFAALMMVIMLSVSAWLSITHFWEYQKARRLLTTLVNFIQAYKNSPCHRKFMRNKELADLLARKDAQKRMDREADRRARQLGHKELHAPLTPKEQARERQLSQRQARRNASPPSPKASTSSSHIDHLLGAGITSHPKPSGSQPADNIVRQLQDLANLRDAGLLDDTQFEIAKERALKASYAE